MTFYIDGQDENCSLEIGRSIKKCIQRHPKAWTELIFLCIGSDRITGDSLGPYIGYKLSSYELPGTFLYGTLASPVHALNLNHTLKTIYQNHKNPLIIAIDASLGTKKHLGYITVGNGSLYPGAGVHKSLPAVGDICITGIVSQSGMLEHFALQNTRLHMVISMADAIADGILFAYRSYFQRLTRLSSAFRQLSEGRLRSVTKSVTSAASTEESW